MKIEVVKTYILVVLVAISLILTFTIWTYKPNFDAIIDPKDKYINEEEFHLDGEVQTKKDIITPESIIFQNAGKYFGFINPNEQNKLYEDMQTWAIYDFKLDESHRIPDDNFQVELRFPDTLPMEVLPSVFSFNEEPESLPSWSFRRVMITFNDSKSIMYFHFLSIDGQRQATATVNNVTKYDLLKSYATNIDDFEEYTVFEDAKTPIFIPKHEKDAVRRSFTINMMNPKKLVNAMFYDPSLVSRNLSNEDIAYYTDGKRQMLVSPDRRYMEFTDPIQEDEIGLLRPLDVIDKSLANINEHKGWTNIYKLDELDMQKNRIKYLMYYAGYPVFNTSLTAIEQVWQGQSLFQYKRPLFKLNNSIVGEPVTLPSGQKVKQYLKGRTKYKLDQIEDIRIGYGVSYEDNASYIMILDPAWFIKYNGNWIAINPDETADSRGVS
ncbi:YycH family regulatory protein [Virgibacillus soli]|uniref:Two-component system activity regulator YycH n=1 Tax=Paracerasibacillus soli TaxID=480284 RepID=A0ABU5CUJ8_9BACI|nr:two-component system activity regulator YycH [Virgibacillus soli]MDY0409910.1 two-component system activity regulator YycH [Virgibacillus soli]